MGYMEDLFLQFYSGEFTFLIPLFWIESVEEEKNDTEKQPVIDFGGDNRKEDSRLFRLKLHRGEKIFGIVADKVQGICQVNETEILLVEEPVLNGNNYYLRGVVQLAAEEEERELLAYVLEPDVLYDKGTVLMKDCI